MRLERAGVSEEVIGALLAFPPTHLPELFLAMGRERLQSSRALQSFLEQALVEEAPRPGASVALGEVLLGADRRPKVCRPLEVGIALDRVGIRDEALTGVVLSHLGVLDSERMTGQVISYLLGVAGSQASQVVEFLWKNKETPGRVPDAVLVSVVPEERELRQRRIEKAASELHAFIVEHHLDRSLLTLPLLTWLRCRAAG